MSVNRFSFVWQVGKVNLTKCMISYTFIQEQKYYVLCRLTNNMMWHVFSGIKAYFNCFCHRLPSDFWIDFSRFYCFLQKVFYIFSWKMAISVRKPSVLLQNFLIIMCAYIFSGSSSDLNENRMNEATWKALVIK